MQKQDYLNISKASDIKNSKDRMLFRFFETLPGLFSVGTLLAILILSWLLPSFVAIFVICFAFYYLFKIFYFSIYQIVSYFKIKKRLKINWIEKLRRQMQGEWQNIYHLVILPTYKEDKEVIKDSLNALLKTDYPKEKLIIVLAAEERAGQEFAQIAKELKSDYENKFFKFLLTLHPQNIAGEIAGKGSNVAWAGQKAKELISQLKIPYQNIMVSDFDIDTKVYPQYFSCLTWYYLSQPKRQKASYQPVPIYNNNIWRASFFSRVVATSNTFWQMIQQERAEKLTTYSSHAMPGPVFFEVGYPANVVCDDSRIFWRAYFYYDGDYRVVPLYYLVSMDAVDSPNILRTAINQYKQQKRWAWGVAEIPYLMFGFSKNKKISLAKKLHHLLVLIEGYWSWATAALLLFILGWLPVFLGGRSFNVTILSFNLPVLTSRIMTVAMVGVITSAILSFLLLPPLPKNISGFKKISVLFQWLFLPFTLIIFGSFPALEAQIRLALGKYMGFWVTEKMRK